MLRGQHHVGRPQRPHEHGTPRAARHRHDLPPPGGLRGGGDHDRPRIGWAPRARVRRSVVRPGAPLARDPVPPDARAHRCVRGGPAGRARPPHDRWVHVRGPALPGARRDAEPEARPAAAPTDLDRCVGRAAHDADRGPVRGRRGTASARSRCSPASRSGSPRTRRPPGAIPRASCARRRFHSTTTGTTSRAPSTNGATPGSAISCAAGPGAAAARVEEFVERFLA